MRERTIERALVRMVKARGGEVRKVTWQGRKGAPDRLVMLPGVSIWVELKAPGKQPTRQQLREHARMRDMGQCVLVIDNLEVVKAVFG